MKIFISHSSSDKWVAAQLSNLIEAGGHSTFLDQKDVKTGESIDSSIQQHLKDSDHLLLLISPASLKSHWVFVELGGAKALGKHVVPILMHVGANELPAPIASLLAREINDFDKYLVELRKPPAKTRAAKTKARGAKTKTKAAKTKARGAKPKARAATASSGPAWPRRIAPKSTAKHLHGFSVGDKVRIAAVEHLTLEDKSKAPNWVSGMDKYSGATTTITAFSPVGWAYLKASGDRYRWHLDWLTKAG